MQALILAAGQGLRLGGNTPKPLLEVGGRTLLARLVEQLRRRGAGEIVVVTGHQRDRVAPAAQALGAHPVFNPGYAASDNLVSFHAGAGLLAGPLILAHADLVVSEGLFDRLMEASGDVILPLDCSSLDAEAMKMAQAGGRVTDLSKTLPVSEAAGESLPLMKFSPAGLAALRGAAAGILASGRPSRYFEEAVVEVIRRGDCPVTALDVTGYPWMEIDTPADLRRARKMFGIPGESPHSPSG
ncbi:MAG: phosphocholine cytidylyltransferase family protein [Candidatus Zixiibacteriota bacterium]|nr:MAG: phosphocholine cytidylyltransferase family protein [candidate division Zixibacteria bacterium]